MKDAKKEAKANIKKIKRDLNSLYDTLDWENLDDEELKDVNEELESVFWHVVSIRFSKKK